MKTLNKTKGAFIVWVWCFWLFSLALCHSVEGQILTTIVTNGPSSNRINVTFLSEGYTAANQAVFLQHATNTWNNMITQQPFAEYASYFNVYAVWVPSTQFGSDHPSAGVYKSTYYNSTYDSTDTIITIDATGLARVNAVIQSNMPSTHLRVMLVNDRIPGGSAMGTNLAITSQVDFAPWIAIHESGHILANLGDEYERANPGYPNTEEPNTTQQTNRNLIKWKAWISTNTPIPTPIEYVDAVGLFQGAHYNTTGWYRPKLNCLMRNESGDFCEVCREALVLSFYQRMRPLDGRSPASSTVTLSNRQAFTFACSPLAPGTHNLDIQWLTNGVVVAGASNASFSVQPDFLRLGSNNVQAKVTDGTPYVLSPSSNLLYQTVSWTVNVDIKELVFDAPRWISTNRFAFRVSRITTNGFVLMTSTNVVANASNWMSISTNFLVGGQLNLTNTVTNRSLYYRARIR